MQGLIWITGDGYPFFYAYFQGGGYSGLKKRSSSN